MSDEINFDGLVGPTHNYGGLSTGNLASMQNVGGVSNPRAAVLQGISKMRALMEMGLKQGVLPPHERVHIPSLRLMGFTGTDKAILERAWKQSPALVTNLTSASAMWTANAATVSPSVDSADKRVHFTAANLASLFHRSVETEFTSRVLRTMFADAEHFEHHDSLPTGGRMGDEGAANHGRMSMSHDQPGVQLFVYGRSAFEQQPNAGHFEARQALEASEAIARGHLLDLGRAVFIRQSRAAIDAGAFHNDVVSVTNGPVLLYHEQAFEEPEKAIEEISAACQRCNIEPVFLKVTNEQVPLADAVKSYLFNSQLVSLKGGEMSLILPIDVSENPPAKRWVDECLEADNPIKSAHYMDLRQSMRNGGGPACLRLRVVLNSVQEESLSGAGLLDEAMCGSLETWAKKHYREQLAPEDLGDPMLLVEGRTVLDELTQILKLGSIYDFQR
jgi:succinylarginine dihydrolase